MFCARCGNALASGTKVCEKCGREVGSPLYSIQLPVVCKSNGHLLRDDLSAQIPLKSRTAIRTKKDVVYCKNCGHAIKSQPCVPKAKGYQNTQGVTYNTTPTTYPSNSRVQNSVHQLQRPQKSRIVAGILGIYFGVYGGHNFYLGRTGRGVLQLILTVCTCGIAGIWGLTESILIFAGVINTDVDGVPLKD